MFKNTNKITNNNTFNLINIEGGISNFITVAAGIIIGLTIGGSVDWETMALVLKLIAHGIMQQ